MSDNPGQTPIPLQREREHTVKLLIDHYAADNLTVEEFEGRLDSAYAAATRADLDTLRQHAEAVFDAMKDVEGVIDLHVEPQVLVPQIVVRVRPDATERFTIALEHARLALRLQGDTRRTMIEFRKHLGWYTKGLPHASELRKRLFQVESITEAEGIFGDYLCPMAQVA